jgi:hypothetical protein
MINVKSLARNKRRFISSKRGKIGTKRIAINESKNLIRVKRNNYINEDNNNDPFGILTLRKFICERFIFISAKIADYPLCRSTSEAKTDNLFSYDCLLDYYFEIWIIGLY